MDTPFVGTLLVLPDFGSFVVLWLPALEIRANLKAI